MTYEELVAYGLPDRKDLSKDALDGINKLVGDTPRLAEALTATLVSSPMECVISVAHECAKAGLAYEQYAWVLMHSDASRGWMGRWGRYGSAEYTVGLMARGWVEKESLALFRAEPLGADFMDRDIAPPEMLVQGMIPIAPFGMVGAGGASKTTLAIKMGLHVITGRPLWGQSVMRTGPVVMVTKEDTRDEFNYRLQQIIKQDADPFLPHERAQIMKGFYLEDLSGVIGRGRFVEMQSDNVTETDVVGDLIDTYKKIKPALLWIDPAVYFGPGERYVNDGEAALMNACRKIATALGCAVGVIHHVSQAVARSGTSDAHAGRGGTAFGDNARGMMVLHPRQKVADPMKYLPPDISEMDVNSGRITQIEVVKLSHGQPVRDTLFAKRHDKLPFRLDLIRGPRTAQTPEEAEEQRLATAEERHEVFFKHYVRAVKRAEDAGERLSKTGVKGLDPRPVFGGKALPKNDVTGVLDMMIDRGYLEYVRSDAGGQPKHLVTTALGLEKFISLRVVE
ncbi:AAA domain-containing protein [Shimia gijangensis]|uniref:AAA domain-containing protein n=1 Tax=Shimia gijangensis TaxID=1470563 RepID=A0A1M6DCS8_9RHOB|nr:AAA family ATPase [Shimia gijangensis]SHI71012.1 AAA domain-containing protein [Shimia gijangensis]